PDGAALPAVTNVGVRPAVDGGALSVETHVVGWSGDLYGQPLRVEFLRFLREERRFASVEELRRQIERDVAAARGG
ncbi:MAG: riboflavin kinase, partial [Oscillospiraceae bacterium]|nr:riboflavin kinase [Oscillospiraceae bacterium]